MQQMFGILSIPKSQKNQSPESSCSKTEISKKKIVSMLLCATDPVTDSLNAEIKIKSLSTYSQYLVMNDYKYVRNGDYLLIKRESILPDKYIFFYDMFESRPYYFEIMYSYKKCVEYIKELQSINVLYNGFSTLKSHTILFLNDTNEPLLFPLLYSFDYSVDLDLTPYPNIPKSIEMSYSSPYMKVLYVFEEKKWKNKNEVMTNDSWIYVMTIVTDMKNYIVPSDYCGMTYQDIYCHIVDTTRNSWDIYGLTCLYKSVLDCIVYDNKIHEKFIAIMNDIILCGGKSAEEVLSLLDYY